MIRNRQKPIRILLCPNAFKFSLTASAAVRAIREGIERVFDCDALSGNHSCGRPKCEIISIPLADGGDGTVTTLTEAAGGTIYTQTVDGPLGRPVQAKWGRLGGVESDTAVVEMAEASGLRLLNISEYDPLKATTFGVGELMKAAVEAGCTKIVVGIGGSATNDGGAGMAQALGIRLLDSHGRDLPFGGAALQSLARIDVSNSVLSPNISVTAACDVNNPLCGTFGASAVYGPQKGAAPEMVKTLDQALMNFSMVIARDLGVDIGNIPGSGAAGGLGAGLIAFCGATLESGIDLVMDLTHFEERLIGVDLIITGEGRLDMQTAMGKVIAGAVKRAKTHNIPVIALVGSIEQGAGSVLIDEGLTVALSITDGPLPLEEAIRDAYRLLADASERVTRLLTIDL